MQCALEDIQNDRNNRARRMGFFVFMTFYFLANQADFSEVTVLLVLRVYAVQFQVGGSLG